MKDLYSGLIEGYESFKSKGKIKDPKSITIIDKYASRISGDNLTTERLMILKLLILSGDDMPHDVGYAAGFQKAYRTGLIIYSRGLGSHDSIMWNLMHMDDIIWQVLKEEGIE